MSIFYVSPKSIITSPTEPGQVPRIPHPDHRAAGDDQQQRARNGLLSRRRHRAQRDLRNLRSGQAVGRRNQATSIHPGMLDP